MTAPAAGANPRFPKISPKRRSSSNRDVAHPSDALLLLALAGGLDTQPVKGNNRPRRDEGLRSRGARRVPAHGGTRPGRRDAAHCGLPSSRVEGCATRSRGAAGRVHGASRGPGPIHMGSAAAQERRSCRPTRVGAHERERFVRRPLRRRQFRWWLSLVRDARARRGVCGGGWLCLRRSRADRRCGERGQPSARSGRREGRGRHREDRSGSRV